MRLDRRGREIWLRHGRRRGRVGRRRGIGRRRRVSWRRSRLRVVRWRMPGDGRVGIRAGRRVIGEDDRRHARVTMLRTGLGRRMARRRHRLRVEGRRLVCARVVSCAPRVRACKRTLLILAMRDGPRLRLLDLAAVSAREQHHHDELAWTAWAPWRACPSASSRRAGSSFARTAPIWTRNGPPRQSRRRPCRASACGVQGGRERAQRAEHCRARRWRGRDASGPHSDATGATSDQQPRRRRSRRAWTKFVCSVPLRRLAGPTMLAWLRAGLCKSCVRRRARTLRTAAGTRPSSDPSGPDCVSGLRTGAEHCLHVYCERTPAGEHVDDPQSSRRPWSVDSCPRSLALAVV